MGIEYIKKTTAGAFFNGGYFLVTLNNITFKGWGEKINDEFYKLHIKGTYPCAGTASMDMKPEPTQPESFTVEEMFKFAPAFFGSAIPSLVIHDYPNACIRKKESNEYFSRSDRIEKIIFLQKWFKKSKKI
jgi:hypothetical protein